MKDEQSAERTGEKMSRRQFLAYSGMAAVGGLAFAGGYIYANNEADDPIIEKVAIPVKGLPPALEGFRIAATVATR